ncbi:diguanylate cyclase domain-containing protein [Thiosulfativibrio zosterae]|uniref:diguanylate cyclase n=1 Tax=Thiosulfativibrio zosterae TaxID=2675053 RepID=A0A6F8PQK5_9GAMM|nr:diguanylate cyclase [Thiosulfativibrio zosterae]BBP44399.1 hypothetical protein THMIRHAT_21450 [Thiosulfativibrio zosterae]
MAGTRIAKNVKLKLTPPSGFWMRATEYLRFSKSRLALQLSVWFMLVSMLPILLVMWLSHMNVEKILTREVQTSFENRLNQRLIQVSDLVQQNRKSLQLLARDPAFFRLFDQAQKPLSGSEQQQTLNYLEQYMQLSHFYDLFFVDLSGKVQFTVQKEADLYADLNAAQWKDTGLSQVFNSSRTLLDTSVSDFNYYPPSARSAAFIATPIILQDRLKGILIGQIEDTQLKNILSNSEGLGEQGQLKVGKRQGDKIQNVLASMSDEPLSHPSNFWGAYQAQTPLAKAVRAEDGQGVLRNEQGQEVYAIWRYQPDLRWGFVYEMPTHQVFKNLNELSSWALQIFGFILLFSGILALFLYGYLSENFKLLLQGIHRLQQKRKNFDPIPVPDVYEFATLAEAFNEMASHLQSSLNELSANSESLAKNKDELEKLSNNLEQMVSLRTHDLLASKYEIRNILDNAPMVVMVKDIQGHYKMFNAQALSLIGRTAEDMLGQDDLDIFPPVNAHIIRSHDRLVMASDQPLQFEEELFERKYLMARFKLRNLQGEDEAICSIGIDITQQVQISADLVKTTQMQKQVTSRLNQALDMVNQFVATLKLDLHMNVLEVSDAFCQITRVKTPDLVGRNLLQVGLQQPITDVLQQLMAEHAWHKFAGYINSKTQPTSFEEEVLWQTSDTLQYFWVTASPVFNEKNELVAYQSFWRETTQEKQIYQLSITDELTHLYNRRYYNQTIEQRLANTDDRALSMIIFDVDYFKRFNDLYGHLAGDQALQSLGQLLLTQFSTANVDAYRTGGEEFLCLLNGYTLAESHQYAEALRQAVLDLKIPHAQNEAAEVFSISVGLLHLADKRNYLSQEIYHLADQALYQAKALGRNQVYLVEAAEKAHD